MGNVDKPTSPGFDIRAGVATELTEDLIQVFNEAAADITSSSSPADVTRRIDEARQSITEKAQGRFTEAQRKQEEAGQRPLGYD